MKSLTLIGCVCLIVVSFTLLGCQKLFSSGPKWEQSNPIQPIPEPPLGIDSQFGDLPKPPTPEGVRLGRWLFFDKRLSADNTIACSTCHVPAHAFSESTPVSTGIRGQRGTRKSPSFLNQAWTLYPRFFWDGRSNSLEDQAKGPIENPIEMGNTHGAMLKTLRGIPGYAPYFKETFGTEKITLERVVKTIADYERTRMSGNSKYDRFNNGEEDALSPVEMKGKDLFFGKAECNQCHLGQNFTDSQFHNLGVGWDAKKWTFKDKGRYEVTKMKKNLGDFKTPGLRDINKHAPYMHDGSMNTLEEVVEHYNKGGNKNPWLSPKIRPLGLSKDDVAALVKFMEALDGEGYQDVSPMEFPQ